MSKAKESSSVAVMEQNGVCVEVAVPLPVEGPFTYLLDDDQVSKAKVGDRVRVPFRNREMVGFLVAFRETPPEQKLKKVIEVIDEKPVLTERMLRLTEWISKYYFSSWGEAIETAVPKWVKQGKRCREKEIAPILSAPPVPEKLILNEEQENAYEVIRRELEAKNPHPILLYGVTGSGKTELYIRAIKEVLAREKGAIVLVPEIALTEQIRRFFFHHFGDQLEILHSKLSDGERFSAWKRIEAGTKRVLLGPRSAVFAPMPNLGLILIDEEHEGSYKQDNAPRYHARDVALWVAKEEKALLILGSATPSLEATYLAEKGIFKRVDLTKRVENKQMPQITLVDLKNEGDIQKRSVILSRLLLREIEANLRDREGTILLLNRRGFSTQIHCPACGQVVTCGSCEVSLTFHQEEDVLLCHYCNFKCPVPDVCRKCSKPLLRFSGFGTEKVESELARVFPHARVARVDTDSIRRKGSHERIIQDFRDKKIDILVGTQMIAKGFDFPHVTLVGVILADVGLMLPDFRSEERTFQLLTQVAGRAGRGEKTGRVIIQTYSPDHPSVECAKDHDYWRFYHAEIQKRAEHHYPPTQNLINILVRSRDEKKAYLFAREMRDSLKKHLRKEDSLELIGPAPLPFYKLRGHYRWHVLIKARELTSAQGLIREMIKGLKRRSGVMFQIDVNPLNIL
ncbi:MAG: primosomal protein N' [Candidatus Omnitrophica bacterium]|nr:primosomal protein N' [Candidatus Omnitrophota bacterium]